MKFLNLQKHLEVIQPELDNEISKLLVDCNFINGEDVTTFENNFSKTLGIQYCVSCANGTDAIYIALKALGVGPGDEVITVANTWVSTVEVIIQCGATPVIVDIDKYHTIDVDKIAEKITYKTKAIIPVHLYGQSADLDGICSLSMRYKIPIVEDCAQSHFSTYKGKYVGTFGDFGTFSFYPGKNLGAIGDAGCLVTNNPKLARIAKMYANHGALVKHDHIIPGINSRLDTIQAKVLNLKLKFIKEWNNRRREIAKKYQNGFIHLKNIKFIDERPNTENTYHLFVIHTFKRTELIDLLKKHKIEYGIHYPRSITQQQAFQVYVNENDCILSEKFAHQCLSLPIHPFLLDEEVENLIALLQKWDQNT